MGEANLCLKITFLIIQFLFVLCGLALIGVGIYLEVVDRFIVEAIQNSTFLAGPYLLIAVGVAILIVAVVGVIGGACSKKFNRVILVLYIVIVFFIFIAEIAGGVVAFIFRSEAEMFVVQELNTAIGNVYGNKSDTTTGDFVMQAVDVLQQQLDCCGLGDNDTASIEMFWADNGGVIPSSCCTTFVSGMDIPCLPIARFNETCNDAVINFVQTNLLIVAVLGIVLIVAEVLVFLLAICLCYSTEYS